MLSYTTWQRFQVQYKKETSTDFWWLFLVEKMLDMTWFWEVFDQFFPWTKLSEHSSFSYKDLFKLEIYKSLIDHRATTDVAFLEEDAFFTQFFTHLPWKSTLNNFQNQSSQMMCTQLREMMMKWLQQFSQLLYSDNGYITVDIDATDIQAYWKQEGIKANKYYGNTIYLPLVVNLFNGLLPFAGKLREWNSYTTNWAVEIIQEVQAYLTWFWGYRADKVLIRWDAWFQSDDIFTHAESNEQLFLCRIKSNPILLSIVWELTKKTIFDEDKRYKLIFNYQANSWSKKRVVVCEYVPTSETGWLFPEYQFFCTNAFGDDAGYYQQTDWEKVMELYHQRWTAEHPFHDFKESFQSGYTNAQSFYVNELKFLISIAAMQIYIVFRELYLVGTIIARSYFSTISKRVICMSAKFVKTGRKVIMKLKEWTKKSVMRAYVLWSMNIDRT